jgi:hypothetical protein
VVGGRREGIGGGGRREGIGGGGGERGSVGGAARGIGGGSGERDPEPSSLGRRGGNCYRARMRTVTSPRVVVAGLGLWSLLAVSCHESQITTAGDPGHGGGTGATNGGGGSGSGGAGTGGGAANAPGCADALIALDRSCSMNTTPRGFAKPKYAVAEDVLKALTADYDSKMPFGLNAFPPLPSEGTKCDAGKVYADIGFGTAGKIAGALDAITPMLPANQNCGTPTGANLEMLAQYPPLLAPGRKHNVILVTDGMPVCSGETVPRSVAAVQKLRMLGVQTFVVGFLVGSNVRALDMMAEAGGQPQPPPAASKFFNAADPDQLNFSLRKILNTICSDIPPPVCPPSNATCGGATSCPAGTACSAGCCFPVIQ